MRSSASTHRYRGGLDGRLRALAHDAGGSPALVAFNGAESVRLSRTELERRTSRTAAHIDAAASSSPVVLLTLGNDAASVLTLIAALRLPRAVAVLDRRGAAEERSCMQEALLRRGLGAALFEPDGRDGVKCVDTFGAAGNTPLRSVPADALLLLSGGSSGRPRVVVDAHLRRLADQPPRVRPTSALNWRAGHRQLVLGPLHHAATLAFFIEGLVDGSMLVMQRAFDPKRTIDLIATERVEWLQATPYHLQRIAGAAEVYGGDLSSLHAVVHIGAPCAPAIKRWWCDAIGADRVYEMYGASEGIGFTVVRGDDWIARPGTVGRGHFTQVHVRDADGRPVAAGVVGDVYFRTGTRRHHPYLDPSDRIRTAPDGFVTVGDRGHLDDNGFLFLAPRQIDRIQVGGETVFPAEVESALTEHPCVLDAGVVGLPDLRWGERVVAAIVSASQPPVDRAELQAHLRERLARHKRPRVIQHVREIPRNAAGKLRRAELAALVESGVPTDG